MSTPPLACIAIPLPPGVGERLGAGCAPHLLALPATPAAVRTGLAEAEGLLCSALFPVDATLLAAAPRLRVIANFGVGFNNVDLPEATRRGIAVCNTPGVLSEAVADLTLALILGLSRRLLQNALYVQRGDWGRSPPPPLGFDLAGKTLGIVGFGRIGRAVARRAAAFGMRVLFYDLFDDPGPDGGACEHRGLDLLLAEADIVTLHLNLTPETYHLIGARELALMKPSASIINTSRGPVIDQAALIAALTAGTIASAGLDVLELEPLAADDPLLALPNVLVLPHVGSATVETREAMMDLAVTNLLAVLAGETPPACVNPEALPRALVRRGGQVLGPGR